MANLLATIDRLGSGGDGVAQTEAGQYYVPFAAPGDRVEIKPTGKDRAVIAALLAPGPARIAPSCRHFGRCGGCALQHLDPDAVAAWKRERVTAALVAAGLTDVPVTPTLSIPPATRRRATLAARRVRSGAILGFAERASHTLIDIAECPVLRPELTALMEPLRPFLAGLLQPGETADIALTLTETGIDLTLVRDRAPTLADRQAIAAFAEAKDLARVAWRAGIRSPAEPVAARRIPVVRFGGYEVALPAGAFLQPSLEGEAALTRLVSGASAKAGAGPAGDLFCGLGTFALAASTERPVAAFDSDQESIAALNGTIRAQGLANKASAARRDLFRDPLTPDELAPFAFVIIDPPRAGAPAQSAALAKSAVPVIAALSCNPQSFARDAPLLVAGGYRLEHVTPVDQFAWSPHVELMATFRRE